VKIAIFLGFYAKVAIAPCFSEVGADGVGHPNGAWRMTNAWKWLKKLAAASE
jgi:hypothetical protein